MSMRENRQKTKEWRKERQKEGTEGREEGVFCLSGFTQQHAAFS